MTSEPKPIERARTVGFRTAILQLVLGALLLTVGTIAVFGYLNLSKSLDEMRDQRFSLVSLALAREITRRLEPADRVLPLLKDICERGVIPAANLDQFSFLMTDSLRQEESLSALQLAETDSNGFARASRGPDGSIVIEELEPGSTRFASLPKSYKVAANGVTASVPPHLRTSFDPHRESWFQSAVLNAGHICWSRPSMLGAAGSAVTASVASSQAVFSADFLTSDIADFLTRLIQDHHLLVFLDTPMGDSLGMASSLPIPEDPVIARCRTLYRPDLNALNVGRISSHNFRVNNEAYSLIVTPFTLPSGFSFLVAVAAPDSEFLGPAWRNLAFTGIVGLIALFVGTIVAIWLSHQLSIPLIQLSRAFEQVAKFQLSPTSAPQSKVREIAIVGDSFERMKSGLRSFVKYVPRDVVRDLLVRRQDAARGGELRELTLFFSDVEGFTRISEGLSATEVFSELGDYLEIVVSVLADQYGGTIDKFVGDGVIAFFNAPTEMPEHAEAACRAALAVVEKLASLEQERTDSGRPIFRTRIGLHTGEVLVGNIGTAHRLAYSVLGDSANLASRLEGLNKLYGTTILASGATREAAGDPFEWRQIDRVAVLGRKQGTDVFELLGYRGEVKRNVLIIRDEYQEGLRAYFAKDFLRAVTHFSEVLNILPNDLAARLLLERCRKFLDQPVGGLWSGVHEVLDK